MSTGEWAPVATLIIGWGLNELGAVRRERSSRGVDAAVREAEERGRRTERQLEKLGEISDLLADLTRPTGMQYPGLAACQRKATILAFQVDDDKLHGLVRDWPTFGPDPGGDPYATSREIAERVGELLRGDD